MLLEWNYDAEHRLLKLIIDNDLYYKSDDAGKTIEKYYKSEKVANLYESKNTGDGFIDEWSEELKWLSENYAHIVGELHRPWIFGYLEKDGTIKDIGKARGQGVVSPENPISLNRLGVPANISEWWDYDLIAYGPPIDDASKQRGIVWYKHKTNGTILRTSNGNGPHPDHIFPLIHGPFIVDISDIKNNRGVLKESLLAQHNQC